jgi:hypothetical protein
LKHALLFKVTVLLPTKNKILKKENGKRTTSLSTNNNNQKKKKKGLEVWKIKGII